MTAMQESQWVEHFPIASLANIYPYRAYIENLLSYNADSKSTHLKASVLWAEDAATHFNTLDHNGDNSGLQTRIAAILQSKTAELFGRLHLDLFQQEKYLLNGTETRFTLNRSSPNFVSLEVLMHPMQKLYWKQSVFMCEMLNCYLLLQMI